MLSLKSFLIYVSTRSIWKDMMSAPCVSIVSNDSWVPRNGIDGVFLLTCWQELKQIIRVRIVVVDNQNIQRPARHAHCLCLKVQMHKYGMQWKMNDSLSIEWISIVKIFLSTTSALISMTLTSCKRHSRPGWISHPVLGFTRSHVLFRAV